MSVALKLDKDTYNLGDTIHCEVIVTNDGAAPLTLPKPELAMPSVSLFVVRPDAPQSESYIIRVIGETEDVELAPGASMTETIELPAVTAGQHEIQAYYNPTGDVHPQFEGTSKDESNTVGFSVQGDGKVYANIETEAGAIKAEFYPERALNHVVSFVQLARRGYFDGIVFHRVVPNFVIQGGDPTGTGGGGPGYNLPAEFNEIKHVPGILSMARKPEPHTAGSQFFVCTADCAGLNNQYTVFGNVVDGLEHVMTIGESESNAGKFHMKKVSISIE